uniref:Secreted protein n=1 Tax=Aquila chrysaetos chrysaetos TaxID=223781 RepID=A0A663E3R2_AQUCH
MHLVRQSRATLMMCCFLGSSSCLPMYVRISRSSDSTSFFASSLSALIKLKAMTSPRCCTSMLSCKQSLCRISSHWVVFKEERDC